MIDVATSELPKAFGDYTLLKPLGRGGMGQVFLARLRARGLAGVDKICVVKTLRSTNDPEYERRFIDEARLIVLLSHRNICPVFDAGCFEGQYYLALEHIAGREVRQIQTACEARGAPLPVAVVIHIIKETLEALDAAHRMVHPLTNEPLRVVHRDVSPQNVMISHEGEVKLIDFGLAVSSQKVEQTAPQVVMGKMAYMAPEQARGEAVDARVDQFAAGIMLYELLTNARYYGDLAVEAMWRMSGVGGHRPALLGTVDDDLRDIIVRATAPRRDDRFPTCADMRDALTAAELRRGAVAGSREVRAALQALDGGVVATSPAAAPSPPPAPTALPAAMVGSSAGPVDGTSVADIDAPTPAPRERTRTFRLVAPAGDRTEVGVVEGLEPGSVITSEEHRPISHAWAEPKGVSAERPDSSARHQDHSGASRPNSGASRPNSPRNSNSRAPPRSLNPSTSSSGNDLPRTGVGAEVDVDVDAPTLLGRPPVAEATVIVRPQATPPESPPPSRTPRWIAAVIGTGALLAILTVVARSAETPPPPPVLVAAVIDAGHADDVRSGLVDAGVPAAADDGDVRDAGTDALLPVDAGVLDVAADAGVVDTERPSTTRPRPRPPKPQRQLPPWPSTLLEKTTYLSKHCNRLECARSLYGEALTKRLAAVGKAAVDTEADKCYQRCR